ncbi:hypothetical protein K6U06_04740 [Acidiferrimicrobium sp. IK]|uniref:hypothetical protein n=1 Tax=Acidiferrimicrobium sp. IK TaxID=2871700 RepID=UPI0021CB474B|nr:hypothetical protein [Acidiferrimicrobium sp. IK]MCU4183656.1 hypothetical protein [Acidiferrimicrobium sp. IK]
MTFEVDTKDCTALADTELADMADIVADGPAGFDIGLLSKQAEAWVLITQVRDGGKLVGFSFCTLERIGGTPCLLWGLASVKRNAKRDQVLKALAADQFRRAVLAFPDEDVLVGTRFVDPGAFAAFKGLEDVCPRPGHKPSGEERAWSRRLAKRFGAEGRIDDRTFVVTGDGSAAGVFDFASAKPETVPEDVAALFAPLDTDRRDVLIAFGWGMAEDLAERYGS